MYKDKHLLTKMIIIVKDTTNLLAIYNPRDHYLKHGVTPRKTNKFKSNGEAINHFQKKIASKPEGFTSGLSTSHWAVLKGRINMQECKTIQNTLSIREFRQYRPPLIINCDFSKVTVVRMFGETPHLNMPFG